LRSRWVYSDFWKLSTVISAQVLSVWRWLCRPQAAWAFWAVTSNIVESQINLLIQCYMIQCSPSAAVACDPPCSLQCQA
jgi:hypothetical protein